MTNQFLYAVLEKWIFENFKVTFYDDEFYIDDSSLRPEIDLKLLKRGGIHKNLSKARDFISNS